MVQMATPWQHPQTGTYYIRRQIPEALRPAFGGKMLYKVSLRTKNPVDAARLFAQANAAFEAQLDVARQRLATTGHAGPSARDRAGDLIHAYFEGPATTESGLDGPERLLLTFFEIGAGLDASMTSEAAPGTVEFRWFKESSAGHWWLLANNAALFRDHRPMKMVREGRLLPALAWRKRAAVAPLELRRAQADRVIEQIRRHHGLAPADLPAGMADVVLDYLESVRLDHEVRDRKPRSAAPRLRPEMRLGELYDEWKAKRQPSAQCALEYRRSVDDFVDYIGDIPVSEITEDDLLTFRDAVAKMPRHLPHADRKLTLSERLSKHEKSDQPKVTATTVKKRVGGVQAMLSFARRSRWIARNVGAGLAIDDDLPVGGVPRRSWQTSELEALFSAPLFTDPSTWRIREEGLSDSTMFWLFLIGATSGARLEEIGQPALADLRDEGGIIYIDIDDYVVEPGGAAKQVKNDESRRVVPLHEAVAGVGILRYAEALRRAGHRELFPDLLANSVGKRTQAASQRANRIIDRYVSDDRRLVFHGLRHTFKQRGTTARIPDRILDQLCGHSPTTVGKKYGVGQPLWVLAEELHKIDFDCLRADRIAKALKDFDWDAAVAKLPRPATRKAA